MMIQKIEFVEGEIEDFIAKNERRPADYADRLGLSIVKFFELVAIYKEKKRLEEAKQEADKVVNLDRKPMVRLTEEQRDALYEAHKAGATRTKLAERFNVSLGAVDGAILRGKTMELDKVKKEKAEAPPKLDLEKVLADTDFTVGFEGEQLVIKIDKKYVTRKLLAGVI